MKATMSLVNQSARVAGADATALPAREVAVAQNHSQWLKLFLHSHAFLKLPAANLQTLVSRMEEVPVRAGQVIVHQGGNANNYYIIQTGQCRVLRQIPGTSDPLELAILGSGDGFGEDALITRGRRNASVIAIQDGILMRLSRHNFTHILVNPVLSTISVQVAEQKARQLAVLLDVRSPRDHRRDGLTGSINIPLPLLRANLARLDKGGEYIAYCNNGTLSAAAAFLLAQRGIVSHLIAGGLREHVAQKMVPPLSVKPSPAVAKFKVSPTRVSSTAEKTTVTVGASLFRDDSQLWTTIPATEKAHPSTLRMLDATPTIHSMGRTTTAVRCLETTQDVVDVVSEMTRIMQQANMEASASTNKSDQALHSGWVSDHYLWETTLGYRRDASLESALLGDGVALQQAASLTIQPRSDEAGQVPAGSAQPSSATAQSKIVASDAILARVHMRRQLKRFTLNAMGGATLIAVLSVPWSAPEMWELSQRYVAQQWHAATAVNAQPVASPVSAAPGLVKPQHSAESPTSNAPSANPPAPLSPDQEMMTLF